MIKMYMGVTQRAKSDWQQVLGDPKKPANWKDETYQAKKLELQQKQLETAAYDLRGGQVEQVSVIIDNSHAVNPISSGSIQMIVGDDAYRAGIPPAMLFRPNAPAFLQFLNDIDPLQTCWIYSFETLDRVRQMLWSVLPSHPSYPNLTWLWDPSPSRPLINLYSLSGAKTEGIELSQFVAYWTRGIKPDELADVTYKKELGIAIDTMSRADIEAAIVYQIAKGMGV